MKKKGLTDDEQDMKEQKNCTTKVEDQQYKQETRVNLEDKVDDPMKRRGLADGEQENFG